MSIADKLTKLQEDLVSAYDAIYNKGGNVPQDKNTNNLASSITSIEGGALQPTLYTPTIALDSEFCVITPNTSNGDFNDLCNYEIYVDNVLTDTTSETRVLLTSIITSGITHTIKVKAISDFFHPSDYSNEVTWQRTDGLKITGTLSGKDYIISINGTLDHNLNVWCWKSTTQRWTQWFTGNEGDSTPINIQQGEYALIWNETDQWSTDDTNYAKIVVENQSGTFEYSVSGNINALLNGNDASNNPYCFYNLFYYQWHLVDAEGLSLPTKDLSNSPYCYCGMFYGCLALRKAPELPAMKMGVGCYELMFCGCDALSQPPSTLSSNQLAERCYRYMFNDCPSMTTAPERLGTLNQPINNIPENAMLNMFSDCVNLTTPPLFNMGIVRENGCRNMFSGCRNLNVSTQMFSSSHVFTLTPSADKIRTNGVTNMFQNCNITGTTTWVDGTPNPEENIFYNI